MPDVSASADIARAGRRHGRGRPRSASAPSCASRPGDVARGARRAAAATASRMLVDLFATDTGEAHRGHLPPARRSRATSEVFVKAHRRLRRRARQRVGGLPGRAVPRARGGRAFRHDASRAPEPEAPADHGRGRPSRCCASRSPIRTRRGGARPVSDDARRRRVHHARGRAPALGAARRACAACPRGVDELATEHLIVNMGPQHPSTHGVLHVLLELDGEEVTPPRRPLGYLHRGIEKLAEHRTYHQVGTLLDRADYVVRHPHRDRVRARDRAARRASRCPRKAAVAPLADRWRSNRLASHLRVARHVRHGRRRDGAVPLHHARPRGAARHPRGDHRRTHDVQLRAPRRRARRPAARASSRRSARSSRRSTRYLDEYDDAARRQRDLPGARARASASSTARHGDRLRPDGRAPARVRASTSTCARTRPYAAYPELDFDVPARRPTGDCWDRYVVRMEEMRQAARMIAPAASTACPRATHTAKVPKVLRPPAGEAYAAVESPRGELGIHLVSDGSDTPYRMHLRSPSLLQPRDRRRGRCPAALIADAVVDHRQPRHRARGDRPMSAVAPVARPRRSRRSG